MKSINFFLVNLVIVLASFNYSAFGQEKEQTSISDEPAKLQVCSCCHGIDGNKSITPDTPKLGGQAADYLAEALKQYQNGMRNHPIMGAMAAGLTKQDIKELSDYFSGQSSQLSTKY